MTAETRDQPTQPRHAREMVMRWTAAGIRQTAAQSCRVERRSSGIIASVTAITPNTLVAKTARVTSRSTRPAT
jgi:hypothetical protein